MRFGMAEGKWESREGGKQEEPDHGGTDRPLASFILTRRPGTPRQSRQLNLCLPSLQCVSILPPA